MMRRRFAGRKFLGEYSRGWGLSEGAEGEVNCDAAIQVLAEPSGSCGARMALPRCPRIKLRGLGILPHVLIVSFYFLYFLLF